MKRIATIAAVALVLPGCAHRPVNPDAIAIGGGLIVDGKGKDHARIRQDGAECHAIAQSTNPEGQAAAGAIAGAVVGALLGAVIFRGSGLSGNRGASYGAASGAIGGGTGGAANGALDFKSVLRNCMVGRGHVPLN